MWDPAQGRWKLLLRKQRLTSLTGGSSEPWCTFTYAIIRGAWSPIFTETGQRTVGSPAAFCTHTVTVNTWNNIQGQSWLEGRVEDRYGVTLKNPLIIFISSYIVWASVMHHNNKLIPELFPMLLWRQTIRTFLLYRFRTKRAKGKPKNSTDWK